MLTDNKQSHLSYHPLKTKAETRISQAYTYIYIYIYIYISDYTITQVLSRKKASVDFKATAGMRLWLDLMADCLHVISFLRHVNGPAFN